MNIQSRPTHDEPAFIPPGYKWCGFCRKLIKVLPTGNWGVHCARRKHLENEARAAQEAQEGTTNEIIDLTQQSSLIQQSSSNLIQQSTNPIQTNETSTSNNTQDTSRNHHLLSLLRQDRAHMDLLINTLQDQDNNRTSVNEINAKNERILPGGRRMYDSHFWNNSGSNGSINVIFWEWINQILNNLFMKFHKIWS